MSRTGLAPPGEPSVDQRVRPVPLTQGVRKRRLPIRFMGLGNIAGAGVGSTSTRTVPAEEPSDFQSS